MNRRNLLACLSALPVLPYIKPEREFVAYQIPWYHRLQHPKLDGARIFWATKHWKDVRLDKK